MYGAAEAFNASSTARVLISYKSIKEITEVYKFNVACHSQVQTSMTGSGQRHTCRLYRQIGKVGKGSKIKHAGVPCDPAFLEAFQIWSEGKESLKKKVSKNVDEYWNRKPDRKRSKGT